jgi:hypothetical protein
VSPVTAPIPGARTFESEECPRKWDPFIMPLTAFQTALWEVWTSFGRMVAHSYRAQIDPSAPVTRNWPQKAFEEW